MGAGQREKDGLMRSEKDDSTRITNLNPLITSALVHIVGIDIEASSSLISF
ncbi:hypothetical protein SynNOUM97013_01786 [Synechococcus sp. NOUM97013]|nr:hypothetical protein SynNOUM97013_01786 [Synechococcus sp. NOUM97013]